MAAIRGRTRISGERAAGHRRSRTGRGAIGRRATHPYESYRPFRPRREVSRSPASSLKPKAKFPRSTPPHSNRLLRQPSWIVPSRRPSRLWKSVWWRSFSRSPAPRGESRSGNCTRAASVPANPCARLLKNPPPLEGGQFFMSPDRAHEAVGARGTESLQTPRWRKPDSNLRSLRRPK
jgi:hypothetical protein